MYPYRGGVVVHDNLHDLNHIQLIGYKLRFYIYRSIAAGINDTEDLTFLAKLDYHERCLDQVPFPLMGWSQRFRFGWHARAIRVLNSKYCMRKIKEQKRGKNAR